MKKHILALGVVILAAALLSTAAAAASRPGATIKLGPSSLGRILVDAHGKTLYRWARDKRQASACYGGCAAYWPVLATRGKPRALAGARQSLVSTTRRRDGSMQVTYAGHPLYRFAGDRRAGQTYGAGLTDFGARWDPVSAAGLAVRAHPTPPRPHFKHPKLKHGVLTVVGTAASDRIALRLKLRDPGTLQVDVGDDGSADFSFERKDVAKIAVFALGGDDSVRVDESNGVFTDSIPTTIDGGAGNDTISGGSGAEALIGGDGNDTIDGNKGNDSAQLGAGDDVFIWDPGDGSDAVEGQDGNDTMRFNDAAAAEQVTLSANGSRLRLFRDVGSVTMDTAGIERVDVNTLGGTDLTTINDLTGTDVTSVNVDQAAALGGTTGDGAVDQVVVNGSAAADAIKVAGDPNGVTVSGLHAQVAISHQEPSDQLAIHGLDGNDSIDASALAAGAIALTLDGGAGNDTIAGSQGVETATGGDGNDTIDGNKGNDSAQLGAGDDVFIWDPGDGSDAVEGQDGNDTMRFNDAAAAEQVTLSANGSRLRLFRDVGSVTMDTAGIERVDVNTLGGTDLTTINDLTGTDVTSVNVDQAAALGGTTGDGAVDRVVMTGTNGNDAIVVSGNATGVNVSGLVPRVAIFNPEPDDRLEFNTLDGIDTLSSVGLAPGTLKLFFDGILVP